MPDPPPHHTHTFIRHHLMNLWFTVVSKINPVSSAPPLQSHFFKTPLNNCVSHFSQIRFPTLIKLVSSVSFKHQIQLLWQTKHLLHPLFWVCTFVFVLFWVVLTSYFLWSHNLSLLWASIVLINILFNFSVNNICLSYHHLPSFILIALKRY